MLFWKAPTTAMNPTISRTLIDAAYEQDAAAAAAEYGAEFRSDLETFIAGEALEACVVGGRRELPSVAGWRYRAFVDPSGGARDAYSLAIAHEERGRAILDVVRQVRPPFSPETVTAEYAKILKRYRVGEVTGDRYAGEWPRERFAKHGIQYRTGERSKSQLYLELLAAINSGGVELLDDGMLLAQFRRLERRTSRSGRDSIDHPPGAHDDLANAAAGALLLAARPQGAAIYTGRSLRLYDEDGEEERDDRLVARWSVEEGDD